MHHRFFDFAKLLAESSSAGAVWKRMGGSGITIGSKEQARMQNRRLTALRTPEPRGPMGRSASARRPTNDPPIGGMRGRVYQDGRLFAYLSSVSLMGSAAGSGRWGQAVDGDRVSRIVLRDLATQCHTTQCHTTQCHTTRGAKHRDHDRRHHVCDLVG